MLIKKEINQALQGILIAFLLFGIACECTQPKEIKLDSALKTHVQLIQEGKTGSARVRIRQFMAKNGESSQPLFLMGLSYHSDKQYAKAVTWFTKSVESSGLHYPPSWHFLGWSQYYLGNIEGAKDGFERYLRWKKEEPDTLFALGLIAMEEGDCMLAESMLQKAIIAAANEPLIQAKAKARLGDVFTETGNLEQAILSYQEAVKQNPDLYEAWHRLGSTLQRIGQTDEAEIARQQCTIARNRVRPDLSKTTGFPE